MSNVAPVGNPRRCLRRRHPHSERPQPGGGPGILCEQTCGSIEDREHRLESVHTGTLSAVAALESGDALAPD